MANFNISIYADRIYTVYQKWWRVEEFHKSIEQNTFCKLELMKLKTSMNHFAIRHKLLLKA